MIRRQGLRLISIGITGPDWGVMALLSKDPFFAGFLGFTQVGVTNERSRFLGKYLVDVGSSFRINASDGSSLKGCSDRCDGLHRKVDDGFRKARALPPYPQLVRDLEIGLEEDRDTRLMNGCGVYERGSPLGFPAQPTSKKLIVAVDVDEGISLLAFYHLPVIVAFFT